MVGLNRPEPVCHEWWLMTVFDPTARAPQNQAEILNQIIPLCDYGFRMFPCRERAKKPAISGWIHRATSDPDELSGLFTCAAKRWSGEFFNAGLATGRGLVVVDVDDQRGEESLYELERK